MLNGVDLFSGYAGIARALRPWVRTVAYCEIERYCHGILLSEMYRGRIDRAPIWDDVRTLRKEHFQMPIDVISGGFPCQDISVAGTGKGLAGERSGLVFEYLRLIGELRPRFVFMENVPVITIRGLDQVLLGLDAMGYDARWTIVSAEEMGAPHRRERWWLLAHPRDCGHGLDVQQISERWSSEQADARSNGEVQSLADSDCLRELQPSARGDKQRNGFSNSRETMAHPSSERREKRGGASNEQENSRTFDGCEIPDTMLGRLSQPEPKPREEWSDSDAIFRTRATGRGWWETEPAVGRVVDECANRCDRIRALGNGVVPVQAREAFMRLSGVKV